MAIKHPVHPPSSVCRCPPPCNPPELTCKHDAEPPQRGTEEDVINHYKPGQSTVTAPACSSSFEQVRVLGSPSLSSAALNRAAGLWLHRDSVIWAATGLRSQPCTHSLSGQRTHQTKKHVDQHKHYGHIMSRRTSASKDKCESSHTRLGTMDASSPFNLRVTLMLLLELSSANRSGPPGV